MNFDTSVLNVAIEDILPNRFQPRLAFDDDSLQDLANSIKQHGIIQPLVLRRIGDKYEIVAGERRYKAAQLAGLATVPAVISLIDDQKSAEVAVAENIQRKELTAIEEAKSYKSLLDQGLMSEEQLAKKLGVTPLAVSNKLKLLTLPTEVQDAILENKISERHAKSLFVINEPEEQIKWLNRIISERLNVRQLDEKLKAEYIKETPEESKTILNSAIPSATTLDTPSMNFGMNTLNLGEKRQNKFFNNLEDEAANMSMTETASPFSSAPSFANSINSFSVAKNPAHENKKEEVVIEPEKEPIIATPEPIIIDKQSEPEVVEEIEMLDFLTADEIPQSPASAIDEIEML